MLTRDSYIAILEKRASDETSIPLNDSAEATIQEHNRNKEDNRQYLHDVFSNAGEAQSEQGKDVRKLFANATSRTITSNPLLKLAHSKNAIRESFFGAFQNASILKTAAPIYLELAYSSFNNELEKITSSK